VRSVLILLLLALTPEAAIRRTQLLPPVATYGHKVSEAVVAILLHARRHLVLRLGA
jgi:hypothetical protein